jgi:hypothetical protein
MRLAFGGQKDDTGTNISQLRWGDPKGLPRFFCPDGAGQSGNTSRKPTIFIGRHHVSRCSVSFWSL